MGSRGRSRKKESRAAARPIAYAARMTFPHNYFNWSAFLIVFGRLDRAAQVVRLETRSPQCICRLKRCGLRDKVDACVTETGYLFRMVDDMDRALRLLADAPVPPALDEIDAGVFARIASRRAELGRSVVVGAATVALFAGVAGGLWPMNASQPGETLTPLVDASALAPSSLLVSHQ